MRIRVSACSSRGPVRPDNQDHYCVGPFVENGPSTGLLLDASSAFFAHQGLLVAVADGMGGYEGGALASQVLLEALSAHFYATPLPGPEALGQRLASSLEAARRTLAHALGRDAALADGGTTLAGAVLAAPDCLVIFHAGDSRVLRFSAGFLRSLTVDHTPVGPDVASGRLTEEQAAQVPGGDRLLRSLGARPGGEVEVGEPMTWESGDVLLLTSDGLHGLGRGLGRRALQERLREGGDLDRTVQDLLALAAEADGSDNATAVLVRIEHEEEP